MEKTSGEEVILYKPAQDSKDAVEALCRRLRADVLAKMSGELLEGFSSRNIIVEGDTPSGRWTKLLNLHKNKGTHLKKDSTEIVKFFLLDERNFHRFLDTRPEKELEVWKELVNNFYLVEEDYLSMIEQDSRKNRKRGWLYDDIDLLSELWGYVSRMESYYSALGYVYMPDEVYHMALTYFYPYEKFSTACQPRKSLDDKPELKIIEGTEDELLQAYHPLRNLLTNQMFKFNTQNKLMKSDVKKVSQQMGFLEYPDMNQKDWQYQRSRIVLTCTAWHARKEIAYKLNKQSFQVFMKAAFEEAVNNDQLICHLLFWPFKGIQGMSSYPLFLHWRNVFSYFKDELPDKDWLSVDSMQQSLLYKKKTDPYEFFTFDCINARYDAYPKDSHNGQEYGLDEIFCEVFGYAFRSYLMMLNALGMADVACTEPEKDDRSFADCIQYVRLTELGRYILGRTTAYSRKTDSGKYFDLDENLLIIKSLKNPNPYINFMSDIARPIGNDRFVMAADTLLKKCRTVDDLDAKIDMFCTIITGKLPQKWVDFFTGIRKKFNPLTRMNVNDYILYKLDASNRELARIIATDEKIAPLVTKVEGYMILVRTTDLPKLTERLKTYGYML